MKANCWVLSSLIGCVMVLAFVLSVCASATAGVFDWRNVSGNDYTTPVKDQGFCGSCWAFAAVGALEAKFDITYSNPGLNLDLSEQHLISDGSSGDCSGGWEYKALDFFRNAGIVSESELSYTASNSSPGWPLESGWENRAHKITANDNWLTCTTDNLKSSLETYGPLVAAMDTYNDWFWPSGAVGEYAMSPYAMGSTDYVDGINHAVLLTGYHDVPSLDEGGYWIVKNSWGTGWGESGYGYILYGDLESHNRVHAITGDAYYSGVAYSGYNNTTPEPATLILIGSGLISLFTLSERKRARKILC